MNEFNNVARTITISVCHLPGVGQNLQDHIEMYIAHQCKQPISLLKYQSGLPMIMSGIKWFLNQVAHSGIKWNPLVTCGVIALNLKKILDKLKVD